MGGGDEEGHKGRRTWEGEENRGIETSCDS